MKYKLSEAVRELGYTFRIVRWPNSVKGALGKGNPGQTARVYQNKNGSCGIACMGDVWDYAYSVSHEIAEHQHGFKHTADMFCTQANLLASWIRHIMKIHVNVTQQCIDDGYRSLCFCPIALAIKEALPTAECVCVHEFISFKYKRKPYSYSLARTEKEFIRSFDADGPTFVQPFEFDLEVPILPEGAALP